MPPTLKVEITHANETTVIRLIGEARLDIEDAAFQLDRVVAFHPRSVVVDVSQLTFLSSIGMSLLLNLRRTVSHVGGKVKLVGIQPLVKNAMEHARLLELFELHADLAGARAADPAAPVTGAAAVA
ncbi:MAG TPA: STAS domain-containing protein [Phycisphaerae bacterium]|jgi:anti-anti-sigma factor|nr:STAS domain-containing protein [Phycisphaerae bacterium]